MSALKRLWGRLSGRHRAQAKTYSAVLAKRASLTVPKKPPTLRDVRDAVRDGSYKRAEAYCRAILAKDDVSPAFYWLGFIALETGRYDLAVQMCQKAQARGFRKWQNDHVLGKALHHLELFEEAFDAAKAAAFASKGDPRTVTLMLETALLSQPFAIAVEIYAKTSKMFPDQDFSRAWKQLIFEHGDPSHPRPEKSTEYTLTSVRAWTEKKGHPCIPVENLGDIPATAPDTIGCTRADLKVAVRVPDPYVADLHDVRIFARSNIIVTADGYALDETSTHPKYGEFVLHTADNAVLGQREDKLLIEDGAFEMHNIDAGIMLSGTASNAFGHWLPEFLPKLQFLERHPEFRHLPLIVDADMPQSHFDYLTCIAPNDLLKMPAGTGLHCQRLIYAPPPTFFPVHLKPHNIPQHEICPIAPATYRYLKRKVEEKLGVHPQSGGKYYLTRRNMKWRRLRNDAEIAGLAGKYGFETVEIERLSFKEQVRLFQSATDIIAPNGSSMQGIIFSDPSVNLLVISQDFIANLAAFNAQIGALGYQSTFLCGPSVGDMELKHSDYVVDPEQLERYLLQSQKNN
ncbi:glycosyltransferase 61 family protein [Roseobacter sp. EG26]|uniref:glycosyltransferase 61 family protein n=1 Tax=Roseobacter sp. EG26 TaxID=3412477 RepID=UPI003CE580DA